MNDLAIQCENDIASRQAKVEQALTIPKRFRHEATRRYRRKSTKRALGEGYDSLPEPFLSYYRVAIRFAPKALLEDREDLLHEIMIGLSRTGQRKASKGEQFTDISQIRIAEHIKDDYWYSHYSYYHGLDCRHCSKAERAKCRWDWAHSDWSYCDCRKAIRLESLNQPVIDSEGNTTELGELIADDKALDLDEWLDAKRFLIGAPMRLKSIALKKNKGEILTMAERKYLCKLRKRYQIKLPLF